MQTRCHLSVLIHEQAKKYGDREVLFFQSFGSTKWKSVSWNQFSLRVKQVSNALLNLGLKPQEKIAVFSQNCIQYLYTDFGAYGVRAVSIPFYATSSEQQIQYMINDANVRFIFVGEQEQYDKAHRVCGLCHSLERIIYFDNSIRVSSHDPQALLETGRNVTPTERGRTAVGPGFGRRPLQHSLHQWHHGREQRRNAAPRTIYGCPKG